VSGTGLVTDVEAALTAWLREQLPEGADVQIEGLNQVEFGHSAETLLFTAVWSQDGTPHRRDVVLRLRPPSPGLLEPYDLRRQFDVLRALEHTPVRAPRALWIEETGDVLGRPFFVMERLDGEVYEREIPPHLKDSPDRIARMSERIFDQIAAIHQVDVTLPELQALGSGTGYVERELDFWESTMHRWQRDTLPALEALLAALRESRPDPNPTITLVHGDAKPGNFAFVDDDVSAVFDWEGAALGDPLADIGWAEMTWRITPFVAGLPGNHFDDLIERYQQTTGIKVQHREWYAAFQAFKMAVIQLTAVMLFDQGHSDDPRFAQMAMAIPWVTNLGFESLGITPPDDHGPVTPRPERLEAIEQDQT
jgi:aminoglycoside phosphotransferase (APT) family kinase protein